jgi:hypothetical protein
MELLEYFTFPWAVLLLVLGLVLGASGFGVLVTGRWDGLILVVIGLTMFWGGWVMSRARGAWCGAAAVLNMFDAASTFVFWNFEANPFVIALGPTLFMGAKIVCSLAIMLYARIHPNPTVGGIALTLAFGLIVGWNLSQHFLVYLGLRDITYGILLGTVFSFIASTFTIYGVAKQRTSKSKE